MERRQKGAHIEYLNLIQFIFPKKYVSAGGTYNIAKSSDTSICLAKLVQ